MTHVVCAVIQRPYYLYIDDPDASMTSDECEEKMREHLLKHGIHGLEKSELTGVDPDEVVDIWRSYSVDDDDI